MVRALHCHFDAARRRRTQSSWRHLGLNHSFNSRRLSALWHVNCSCKHCEFAKQEYPLTFLLIIELEAFLSVVKFPLCSHSFTSYKILHLRAHVDLSGFSMCQYYQGQRRKEKDKCSQLRPWCNPYVSYSDTCTPNACTKLKMWKKFVK